MYPGFKQLDKQYVGVIFETLLAFSSTFRDEHTFDSILRKSSLVNFPMMLAFVVGLNYFYQIQICALCANRYDPAHDVAKTTCAD